MIAWTVDLQSEVRAPLVQAPVAWVARKLLSSNACVQAVVIMTVNGEILAHERALGFDDESLPIDKGCSLIYYAPRPGLLFYVRTDKEPLKGEVASQVEAIIGSPRPVVTR